MSDEHKHESIRFTIYFKRWWGKEKMVLIGTSSSLKDGELLIFKDEGFTSINYANVILMVAEAIH